MPWRLRFLPERQGESERMRGSRFQSRPETPARLVPGNEFNGSAVDLLKTPLDFLPPGFLGASVDRLIQTANQGIDQRSAGFRRQGQRVSQHFRRIPFHESILPPAAPPYWNNCGANSFR